MLDKNIKSLVEENYVHGFILNSFGIRFYEFFEKTLDEVCDQKGLNPSFVIKELERRSYGQPILQDQISTFSTELIISYLKSAHFEFIKHKLPYIAEIIKDAETVSSISGTLLADLKILFPLFAEDFIHHIYEEEDTLFCYVKKLGDFLDGKLVAGKIFYEMDKYSMKEFASEHEDHDDEMEGIRALTNGYKVNSDTDLVTKVLFFELQGFEKELITHASVENKILFPKACRLEEKALSEIKRISRLN
ncbi:MAG: hemerythrin domain-containing protein [Bacteroidota bacterium]